MFWIGFGCGFVTCFIVLIVLSIISDAYEDRQRERASHPLDARTARRQP